jgi:hypothetical protein
VVLAGCGSTSTHVVRVTGEVGPLQMDRSDEAAVVAFAGKPDASIMGTSPGYQRYRALGYDCAGKGFDDEARIVGLCQTVFFFDRRTGKFETFSTSSPQYSEGHGVRIGMKQTEAEHLLNMRLTVGCTTALHFDSPTGALSIDFAGGVESGTSIRFAHVDAFVLHSKHRDAGVFDCL